VTDLSNTLSSTSETMKRFQLVISKEKWAQIKPTHVKHMDVIGENICHCSQENGRMYLLTKYGSKRSRAHSHLNALKFLLIVMLNVMRNLKEHATSGAQLMGILYNKPAKKSDVVFRCTFASFSTEITHKKKRYLKGSLREKIAS